MIRFACPKCGKAYKASPEQAGHTTVCKRCGASVVVPKPVMGVPLPPPAATPGERPPGPPPRRRRQKESVDDGVPIRSTPTRRSPGYGRLLALLLSVPLIGVAVVAAAVIARSGRGGGAAGQVAPDAGGVFDNLSLKPPLPVVVTFYSFRDIDGGDGHFARFSNQTASRLTLEVTYTSADGRKNRKGVLDLSPNGVEGVLWFEPWMWDRGVTVVVTHPSYKNVTAVVP